MSHIHTVFPSALLYGILMATIAAYHGLWGTQKNQRWTLQPSSSIFQRFQRASLEEIAPSFDILQIVYLQEKKIC